MKHEPKLTVSVRRWCNKCTAFTDHRVDNGRPTRICIPCGEKAEVARLARLKAEADNPRAVQERMFA